MQNSVSVTVIQAGVSSFSSITVQMNCVSEFHKHTRRITVKTMMSDHYAVSFIQRLECEIILHTAVEQSVALHFIDGKKCTKMLTF